MKKTLLCVAVLAALAGCSSDDETTITNIQNHNPVANADEAFVVAGGTIEIDALKNDTDADGDNLSLSVNETNASAGVVSVSGNIITYTAPSVEVAHLIGGEDVIQYTVGDGNDGQATSYIKVRIADNTLPPVPVDHVIAKDAEFGASYVLGTDLTGMNVDLKLYEHQKPYEEINGLYDYIEVKAVYGHATNDKVTEQGPYNGFDTIMYNVGSVLPGIFPTPTTDTVLVSYYKNQYNAAGELDLPKLVDEQTITVQLLRNDKPDIPHAAAPTGTATFNQKEATISFAYENTDALSRFSTGHSLYEVRDGKPVGAPFFSTDQLPRHFNTIKLTYTPAVAAANSGDGFVWVDAYQDGKNVQSEAFKIDATDLPMPRPELPTGVGSATPGTFQAGTHAIAQLTDTNDLVIWAQYSPKSAERAVTIIPDVEGYKLSDSGDAVVYWSSEEVIYPQNSNMPVVKTVTVSTDLFASIPKKADISVTSLEGFTGVPVDGFQAAISDNGLNVILSNAKFTDAKDGGYGGDVVNSGGTADNIDTAMNNGSCENSGGNKTCGGWVQTVQGKKVGGVDLVFAKPVMHSGTVAPFSGALGFGIDADNNGFAWTDNQNVNNQSVAFGSNKVATGDKSPSPVIILPGEAVVATHITKGKKYLASYAPTLGGALTLDLMPIDKTLTAGSLDGKSAYQVKDGVTTTTVTIATHVDSQLNVNKVVIVDGKVKSTEEALTAGTSVGENQGVALLDDNRTVLATGENGEVLFSY